MSKISYGGQAVIEGVMMAGPKGKAIACRKEDGEIVYKVSERKLLKEKYPILGWPVIRGFISFCESIISGLQDITWSAAQCGESEEEQLTFKDMLFAIVIAAALVILIFVVLPVFVANFAYPYVGDFGRSLIEGLLRAGLFLVYVVLIGKMKDIARVFAYHGAEHKTINAFEAGVELTPENVKKYSCIHTRCGTSFIIMAMLLMIIIFTFVGQTTPLLRILIKLACMPLVAGLAYELFRLPLKFPDNPLIKALVRPGLAMQRLTTNEPDLEQIEVAIAALTAVPGFATVAEKDEYAAVDVCKKPHGAVVH